MTRDQAVASIVAGAALASKLADAGITAIGVGEMGIGNTTVRSGARRAGSSARPGRAVRPGHRPRLETAWRARPRSSCACSSATLPTPPIRSACWRRSAASRSASSPASRSGSRGPPVVVLDGFITGAAALVAVRLAPALEGFLVASHRSAEPGHRVVLEALGLAPLLELDLRLGEGSGAALALPILAAARDVLVDMATFADAGVTDTGR